MSPPEAQPEVRYVATPRDIVLAIVWGAAAVGAVFTFTQVWQVDNDTQPEALTWAGGLVAMALAMAAGPWIVNTMLERPDSPRFMRLVGVARVALLVPWALALYAAASGFGQ